jgi:predicted nucleic acid-binding protein
MKFWDTSALGPLLVAEDATTATQALYRSDPVMVVAWTTSVECASAIARAEHDAMLTPAQADEAFARLDDLSRAWREVEPGNEQHEIARRLLRVHRLRAADALQLAAASLAAERRPASLELATLDDRLEAAARREGFSVIVPGRPPAEDDAHADSN